MSMTQIFDAHIHEMSVLVRHYNELCLGKPEPEQLALRREQHKQLIELLTEQARAMTFLAGEPIEPKTHFGEGILLPAFGAGEPSE